jgi:twitching motility protein PilT
VFDIDGLLEELWRDKGTDMLLLPGARPFLRINGDLRQVENQPVLEPLDVNRVLSYYLTFVQKEQFDAGSEIDFSFEWRGEARIRGNAYHQRGVQAVAFRMIPRVVPSFDDLRIPMAVRAFTAKRQGLVLVTGPTGSGKSTSLAALVAAINHTRNCHIITIEDPIEYVHDHAMAAVSQREIGSDSVTFSTALRSALREDPDVVLVGELRDLDSIRFALTLAETGHLVLATLHTNDTSQAVDRLVDVFPGDQQPQIRVQLAQVLTAIVYQRLIPRISGQGSVAAYEVLVANNPVRNLIREAKTVQLRNQLMTGQRDGSQTLEVSLSALVAEGLVSREVALSFTTRPKDIA